MSMISFHLVHIHLSCSLWRALKYFFVHIDQSNFSSPFILLFYCTNMQSRGEHREKMHKIRILFDTEWNEWWKEVTTTQNCQQILRRIICKIALSRLCWETCKQKQNKKKKQIKCIQHRAAKKRYCKIREKKECVVLWWMRNVCFVWSYTQKKYFWSTLNT